MAGFNFYASIYYVAIFGISSCHVWMFQKLGNSTCEPDGRRKRGCAE